MVAGADDGDRVGAVELRVVLRKIEGRIGEDAALGEDAGPEERAAAAGDGRRVLRENGGGIGQTVVIVGRVDGGGLDDLAEVVGVDRALGSLADLADGRENQRGQDADDGDDREQLDEREAGRAGGGAYFHNVKRFRPAPGTVRRRNDKYKRISPSPDWTTARALLECVHHDRLS